MENIGSITAMIETARRIRIVAGGGDAPEPDDDTRSRTVAGLDRILRREMACGAAWAIITTPAGDEFRYPLFAGRDPAGWRGKADEKKAPGGGGLTAVIPSGDRPSV